MSLGQVSTATSSSSSVYDKSIDNLIFPDNIDRKSPEKTVLYQELRLIERNENEINVCWKGAHMMLFFMSFVFGSLCTCCIHRLNFMFNANCVLYPKLVTHASIHRMVYEFFSLTAEKQDFEHEMPVEFVTTQWAEPSVCYLPTYVPLVSGLVGLVWTTMILMCSSGASHNVAGAQRHWRALPIMFLCSLTMAVLCIYSSTVTHRGLRALCSKLAEVTDSRRCTFPVNVATLVYERRIHGVYQATLLSIASAWLHTGCWILSTLLIAARVLLAVDFTLVYVKAQIIGNLDDILQKHERQINYFNAESPAPYKLDVEEEDAEVELYNTHGPSRVQWDEWHEQTNRSNNSSSKLSLVPEMRQLLIDKYVHNLLYNLLKNIGKPRSKSLAEASTSELKLKGENLLDQSKSDSTGNLIDAENADKLAKEFTQKLHEKLTKEFDEFERQIKFDLENKGVNVDIKITDIFAESKDQISSKITEKFKDSKIKPEENTKASEEKYEQDKVTPVKRSVDFNIEQHSKTLMDEISNKPKIKGGNEDEVIEKPVDEKTELLNDRKIISAITENLDDKAIELENSANASKVNLTDDNANTTKGLTDDDSAEKLAREFTQKLHEIFSKEFDDFERHVKYDLNKKDVNRDIEVTDTDVDPNDQISNKVNKVSENVKNNIMEPEDTISNEEMTVKYQNTSLKRSDEFHVEPDSITLTDDISGKPKKKNGQKDDVIEKPVDENTKQINDKKIESKITDIEDDKEKEPENNTKTGMKKHGNEKETSVSSIIQIYPESDSKTVTGEVSEKLKSEGDEVNRPMKLDDDKSDHSDSEENKDQKKDETKQM